MLQRALAVVAFFLAALALPAMARAQATRIELYQLTVRPEKGEVPAHFELDLTYYAPTEHKTSGFKLVGKRAISKLRARSGIDGTPIAVKASPEVGSGETKIDFDLPKPDARGRQRVVVDFDQGLEIEHGFFDDIAVVPWAHQFRIPVDRMTLAVAGPRMRSGEGLVCKKGAPQCSLSMKAPFEATFAVGDASLPSVVAWIATLSVTFVAFVVLFVFRRRKLLELRGVLPPAAPVAYPDLASGYRAPPPLPQPTQAAPVLSEDDTVALWSRAFVALGVVAAPQLLLARCTLGFADLHVVMAVVAVIAAVGAFQWGLRGGHFVWLFVGLAPLAWALIVTSIVFAPILILGAIIATIVTVAVRLSKAISTPTGWGATGASATAGYFAASTTTCSSSSSSCSSSSCGGGGGSSCGGGGGGGGCGG